MWKIARAILTVTWVFSMSHDTFMMQNRLKLASKDFSRKVTKYGEYICASLHIPVVFLLGQLIYYA